MSGNMLCCVVFLCFIFLSILSPSAAISSSDLLLASDYNRIAIELAESQDLSSALTKFALAVKLDENNYEYINNYGVTLMRLGKLKEAREQFQLSLQKRPNYQNARDNLTDLEKYMKDRGLLTPAEINNNNSGPNEKKPKKKKKQRPQETQSNDNNSNNNNPSHSSGYPHPVTGVIRRENTNKRMKLPRIDLADLYSPENSQYALGHKPFIITNGLQSWNLEEQWSLNYFQRNFADATADFYPHNMDKSDTHPYLTALSRAIEELQAPSTAYPANKNGHPGTYIQWNVPHSIWLNLTLNMPNLPYYFHRDDEWLENCFSSLELRDEFCKRTHWRMILIGNIGAGMFNHQDVLRTSSWQAQVAGKKRWHLCHPSQGKFLYSAGQIDAFDPDYSQFPLFSQANCYEDIVERGEMLYYPQNYWHQTENLGSPSIAVSGTILDEHNHSDIARELAAECKDKKFNWYFSTQLCRELEQCFDWWKGRYSPSDHSEDNCPSQ
jgi:tetratricopeptide (TPR) repeat protein